MLKPAGKPLLDTAHYLFAKFFVLNGAGRLRRERKNRFLVGRGLFQTNALGDHSVEKFSAEHAPNLFVNFLSQSSALVVKCYQHAEHLQLWIRPGLDLLDRL